MQIRVVTKWVVEDFTEQQAQTMRRLGWHWKSPSQDDNLLNYGHFYTYDKQIVDKTAAALPGSEMKALCLSGNPVTVPAHVLATAGATK